MNRPKLIVALCAAFLLISSRPGLADSSWDLIYTDHLDLTLCSNGCGIVLGGLGFALLINTGTTDINAPEFFGATFEETSSNPAMTLHAFINNPGPPVAPIHPGEAVGSVPAPIPGQDNTVLLTQLHPGETFRNTADLQVLAFNVGRTGVDNTFEGPVHFDIKMTMGEKVAHFGIDADVHLGDPALTFPSAARVSGTSIPTPAGEVSWGHVKSLYR